MSKTIGGLFEINGSVQIQVDETGTWLYWRRDSGDSWHPLMGTGGAGRETRLSNADPDYHQKLARLKERAFEQVSLAKARANLAIQRVDEIKGMHA